MVGIHTKKHITFTNLCLPPRDADSPHYETLDTDITNGIPHIIDIQDSILTCDVNLHSPFWYYAYIDDHKWTLITLHHQQL